MPGLLQAIFGNGGAAGTTTTTKRMGTFSSYMITTNTLAGSAVQPVDHAVTISDWRLRVTTAPGSGVTRTFTVYKNGSPTSLVVAIAGTNQTGSDLANSVTFAAGDTTYIEQVITGGTPADTLVQSVFACDNPDYFTSLLAFGTTANSLSSTVTAYTGFLYGGEWGGTAVNHDSVVAVPGTVTGYRVQLTAAPGAAASGKTRTFVLEKNGTAQDGSGGTPNTTILVSETATTGSTTFTLTLAVGDLLRLKETPANTPVLCAAHGTGTFVATTAGQWNMGSTTEDTPSTSLTEYHPAFGNFGVGGTAWTVTEGARENIGPETTLTVSGLYVALVSAPGAGNSYVFTLRKNTASTAQTVTVADAATTSGPSGGAAVTITNADRVSLECVPASGPTLTRVHAAFLMTDPTVVLGGTPGLLVSP